ncbi:MAG: c-type cytochrome [Gemmatimonadota bacterium]|nr:c-type cytochrome [Gemmatimonadota bacterium]
MSVAASSPRRALYGAFGAALVLIVGAACDSPKKAQARADTSAAVVAANLPVMLRVPADSTIPSGPFGASIRRGRAIFNATRDSLPTHVGSNLRCASCHLDGGARADAAPLVGVSMRYPQYRQRNASIIRIEERVNDCFQRSLNGTAIAWDSGEMRDIVSYLSFLSRGVVSPGIVPGQGLRAMPGLRGDSAHGSMVFDANCARCHGPDGAGTVIAPALWGARSYNIAASMARANSAASFIKHNMPFDKPKSLSDQDAFDAAAYINSHARPDFKGKENDWPNGDAPADVPYKTKKSEKDR